MDDFYNYFLVGQFYKTLFYCFYKGAAMGYVVVGLSARID